MPRLRLATAAGHGAERLDELRETEVDDLDMTLFGDHDVGRLEVPMDHELLVSFREALGKLGRELERS